MAQLSCQHTQLAAMMRLVGDKVVQKVDQVRRKILPGCGWNRSTASDPKLNQINHPTTAVSECTQQFRGFHRASVYGFRNRDAMTRTDHLDPHASGVMDMGGDRSYSATRRAGNIHGPQFRGQILDEVKSHAVVCLPRGN